MSTEEVLTPGTVFAGYEIVRVIGEGGFGMVYEAVKPSLPQPVALKVLRAEVADNAEVYERFLREATTVAKLHHPNIVGYVELDHYEGMPYLAMELLHGEPLTARMNRDGRLPLSHAVDLIVAISAAVRAVHRMGVVHRDLKPDNLFLVYTPEGRVVPKILDFGFAKLSSTDRQLTQANTAIGTPNFMSPEQMLSPLAVDPRSDQWALGVLLYYLLTGIKPFAAKTLPETLNAVLQREPAPLAAHDAHVPEAVERTILRALRKRPDERFPSVHEFAAALMPFAGDDTALLYAAEFEGDQVWDDFVDLDVQTAEQPAAAAPPGLFSTPPSQPPQPVSQPQQPASYVIPASPAHTSQPPADLPYVLPPPGSVGDASIVLPLITPARHTQRPAPKRSVLPIVGAVAFAVLAIAGASLWAMQRQTRLTQQGAALVPADAGR